MSDVSAWHVDFNVDIYRMKKKLSGLLCMYKNARSGSRRQSASAYNSTNTQWRSDGKFGGSTPPPPTFFRPLVNLNKTAEKFRVPQTDLHP